MFDLTAIKFNQLVWHDQPYLHPHLRVEVRPDFYDRTEQKNWLKAKLQAEDCAPLVIMGERRAGKTSLLMLMDHYLALDPAGRFIPVFIPWVGRRSGPELIREIWQAAQSQMRKMLPDRPQPAEASPATPTELIEALRHLPLRVGQKVVLEIDELDSLIEEASPEEKRQIEELTQVLLEITDLPVQLLVTMVRLPDSLVAQGPSLGQNKPVYLSPFSWADLEEMVRGVMGAAADSLLADEFNQIYELTGGWSWWAKLLLVGLAETWSEENRLEQAAAWAIKQPNAEVVLENVYTYHFDESEKAVVLKLAAQNYLNAGEVADLDPIRQAAIARLGQRGYVRLNSDGSYNFRIGLLAQWFRAWNRFEEEIELYSL